MESVVKRVTATSLLASCAVSLALFTSCAGVEQNTLTLTDGNFFSTEKHSTGGKTITEPP